MCAASRRAVKPRLTAPVSLQTWAESLTLSLRVCLFLWTIASRYRRLSLPSVSAPSTGWPCQPPIPGHGPASRPRGMGRAGPPRHVAFPGSATARLAARPGSCRRSPNSLSVRAVLSQPHGALPRRTVLPVPPDPAHGPPLAALAPRRLVARSPAPPKSELASLAPSSCAWCWVCSGSASQGGHGDRVLPLL